MPEMRITVETARTEPNYRPLARALLDACREWYKNPENMQAYLDWKKNGRNEKDR